MSEIPYTPLTKKISRYFAKFQDVGIPDKVSRKWLESLGYKSGNDVYIIRILKAIGFLDTSNVPTDKWRRYKDPTLASAVLAEGIRAGYSDLFETYEDAFRKDREALYAYFSSKTGKAKRTVDLMVNTFVNLCQLADFEAVPTELAVAPKKPELPSITPKIKGVIPEIHINIQLHLPATDDPSIYENLFKSLKKHLLSAE